MEGADLLFADMQDTQAVVKSHLSAIQLRSDT